MTNFTAAQRNESREEISRIVNTAKRDSSNRPIIYTVLRSESRSGMMRCISAYVINDNGDIVPLSWHYDRSHGRMADDRSGRWANKVSGCGMDMGYHLAGNIAAMAGLSNGAFHHEWI